VSETVLIRLGALGDLILLGSVTGQIKGDVTVITAPRYVEIAKKLIGVTRVLHYTAPDDIQHLRDGISTDAQIVDLHNNKHSRKLSQILGGSTSRINKRSVRRRLRLLFPKIEKRPTVPELYAESLGVSPAALPWILTTLQRRDALAIAPGAAWATKRPRLDVLAAVGRAFEGPVILLGGPDEAPLLSSLAEQIPGAQQIAEKGFEKTIEALNKTAVLVSGDSGLMHLGGALGCRVVAIFGPTHPDDGFFVYPGTVVGRDDLSCRPCTLHRQAKCPKKHHGCMDISPLAVNSAVKSNIEAKKGDFVT
jgi:heptosyltransferase-2